MAIFNEAYTCDVLSEKNNDIEVIEEAAGLDDLVFFIATVGVSIVVGSAALWAANKISIKSALAKYPKDHDDCKPLKSFTRKIYNIAPYKNEPGKEMGPVKRRLANSWLFKKKFDKCVCYLDGDGEIAMFYCYRHNTKHDVSATGDVTKTTRNEIAMFVKDEKLKKHEQYYFSAFLNECKMTNKDTIRWAREVLKGG